MPFLITPHHPHGGSSLLGRGCLLDKPRTFPLTSQAPGATIATALPSTRPASLDICRDSSLT